MVKSRGRSGRGGTSVLQNYNTTVFYTYIPYNDLKHYKNDNKDHTPVFLQYFGWTDGGTGEPTWRGVELTNVATRPRYQRSNKSVD